MRKQSFLLVIAILLSVISPGLVSNRADAAGGTVTKSYTASADTMELRGQPEYNGIYDNDGDGFLNVGMSNNDGFVNVRNRMAMMFNLGVPEGTIVSAELVLTVATVLRVPGHNLYTEVRGSTANDLNLVSFPPMDTNTLYADKFTAKNTSEVPMGTYLQNQTITLNVKSAVDAFTDSSDRKLTLILNGNESDADSGRFLFYSMETANAAYHPKLVVTYETGPANTIPTGSFAIIEGAATSSSFVNLSVTGSDADAGDSVTHMRFSNSAAGLSAASWLPFSNSATFSLAGGDGAKTIYMQLMDSKNGISNTSSQSILLDQTPPTGFLIINNNAAFTKNYTVTLSGSYSDGSGSGVEQARLSNVSGSWQTSWFNISDLNGRSWVLSAGEGAKTIYVQYKDRVGNLSTGTISSTITVDTIPPVISNVENSKTYNKAIAPAFNEGSGLLNGNPFNSGTEIVMDGTYTLTVTDSAGNSTTVNFKIDTAPPVVTGVTNGGIYKGNVTVTFNKGTATLNGAAFTSGTAVTMDGTYTLVVTDQAGNVTTVGFEIDKTAPIVSGVTHGGSYKAPVTVIFNEGTATLNGAALASGMRIDADGSYTLVVTDAAGNATTVSFVIDRAAPIVTGVVDGGIYKDKVTVSFNEGTATLNGTAFTSSTEVNQDGTYKLIVTDAAGNVTTVNFVIDRVAPIVTGATDGGMYKDKVTVSFNEGTATLNGTAFTSGTEITVDGSYTLVVTDVAGNVTTMNFVIDRVAPIVTGVADGGIYKDKVTVSYNEGTATLNGISFTSGTEVNQDGTYKLIVTDAAGNATTVSFVIDRSAPIVTGVADGGMYKDKVTVSFNEGTSTLNGASFTSGTEITVDGSYVLVVTDAAGNVTTVNFVIDKVAPIVTGVADGGMYKDNVTVSYNEGTATLNGTAFTSGTEVTQDGTYKLIVTDAAGNTTTVNFVIDKVAPIVTGVADGGMYKDKVTVSFNEGTATLNGAAFTSGTEVTQDGTYKLVVTDAAGNVTTVNFVIDTVAPIVTGVADGGIYKDKVTVSFNEGTATLNGAAFTSGTEVIQDGTYKLIVTDAAGNVTTVNFVIDKVAPVVTGVTEGGIYKEKVTVSFNEGTATLNGTAFTSGTEVIQDGIYKLIVTDAAGNVTTVNFVIDTVAPIVTGVADGGMYKDKVTVGFNEGTAKLNGAAFTNGTEVTADGSYTLVITDAAGNATTVNFVIDKVAPIVTGVTEGGMYKDKVTVSYSEGTATLNGTAFTSGTEVNQDGTYKLIVTDAAGNVTTVNFVIDTVAPIVTGVADGGMYKDKVTINFNEGTAKLNGTAFTSGTEITVDGSYTLVVTDGAGNAATIIFLVDTTAPTGTLTIDQAGSEWTNVADTTLTLTSDDSSKGSGVVEMRFSGNGTNWSSWEPSAATKAWSFGAGDGEKSVFVQFKDKAGNVSHSVIQDKIKLDQTIPTGMITINSGAAVTSSKEVKLSLTSSDGEGSGVTEMRFSADKLAWSAWENVLLTKNWILDGDYGSKQLYVQYRDAAGNNSVAHAASIEYQASSGSSNGGGSTETNSDITVSIGNKPVQMIKATVRTIEGKKVTTLVFEEAQLKELLNGAGDNPVITITVHNQSDIVNWEINAGLLSAFESSNAVIQLMSEKASYSFPLDQVHIDKWLNQFGSNVSLKDITLKMEIIHAPNSEFVYKDRGNGQITLFAPPVKFSVKAYFGGKEIELNQFDTFVERSIALPEGLDPKRITTGVKLISDGSLIHIPTKVIEEGGRYYAVLSSMTNSMYGLIYHQKSFSDVATHWAKTSINDLASRLIINGSDEQRFLPDNEITRAEFTAIMIRALGLSSAAKSVSFTDISEKDWYHSAAQIAYSYGLVDGYSDGSFKPNEKITRQEAMVILSRAMKLADLYNELGNVQQQNLLHGFKDNTKLAAWARQAAALTIQFGVIGGYNGELQPQKNITRAETAAIIQRLLQKATFI
ncbi:S-layer homology domain-containing protein [Paenibacillus sp. NRS-1760]|uniref:S-layer homology domain-containing protein n=1 Tax=Paenibacillus sp. NRS-1760 TaxID=3233902 RepID=UPI003D2E398B